MYVFTNIHRSLLYVHRYTMLHVHILRGHIYMYIYKYIYIYIYIYKLHIYIYIYIYIYTWVYIYVHIHIFMHTHIYIYTCIYVCAYTFSRYISRVALRLWLIVSLFKIHTLVSFTYVVLFLHIVRYMRVSFMCACLEKTSWHSDYGYLLVIFKHTCRSSLHAYIYRSLLRVYSGLFHICRSLFTWR